MRVAKTQWQSQRNWRKAVGVWAAAGSLALIQVELSNRHTSAEELTATKPTAGTTIESASSGPNDWNHWIEDLDDPSFAARRIASQQLEAAGIQAFELLADAAIQRNREAAYRALEILERGLRDTNVEQKTASKKAIERVAASTNQSAARAAQELLRDIEHPRPNYPIALMNGWMQPNIRPPIVQLGARAIINGVPVRPPFGGPPPNPLAPIFPQKFTPPPNAIPGVPGIPGQPPANGPGFGDRQVLSMLDDSIAKLRKEESTTTDPKRLELLRTQIKRSEELKRIFQSRSQPPVR